LQAAVMSPNMMTARRRMGSPVRHDKTISRGALHRNEPRHFHRGKSPQASPHLD
jgi:hypothetical protein